MVEKKHPLPEHIQVPWPERDALKLRVVQDGEEIMLMTYRYPVDPSVRKGVIFHIHGFGSYCERYAFMAKMWAEAGYEVIAFDQRGFGNSGGQRGFFEDSHGDLQLLIFKSIQQFNLDQQTVPLFLYGSSFGGLLAFNLSIKYPTMFSGLILNSPFFQQYTDTIDKYKYLIKFFNFFKFFFSVNTRDPNSAQFKKIAAQYPWVHEDEKSVTHAKVSTLSHFIDEQQFAQENYKNCKTPIIVALAKEDVSVKNSATIDIIDKISNPANRVIEIEGADHTTICIDLDLSSQVVRNGIDFLDSIVASKQNKNERSLID